MNASSLKKTLKTLEKQQFSPTFHEFYLFGQLLLGKWGSWGSTEGTVEVFEKPVWKQAHLCHRKYLLLFKNEPDQWSDHIRRHILELSGLLRQSVSWKDKPTALSNQPHLSPNGSVINRLACAGRHIVNGLLKYECSKPGHMYEPFQRSKYQNEYLLILWPSQSPHSSTQCWKT